MVVPTERGLKGEQIFFFFFFSTDWTYLKPPSNPFPIMTVHLMMKRNGHLILYDLNRVLTFFITWRLDGGRHLILVLFLCLLWENCGSVYTINVLSPTLFSLRETFLCHSRSITTCVLPTQNQKIKVVVADRSSDLVIIREPSKFRLISVQYSRLRNIPKWKFIPD